MFINVQFAEAKIFILKFVLFFKWFRPFHCIIVMMLIKNANILIIDDDQDVLTALRLLLKPLVSDVVIEKNPGNIDSLINRTHFDIVILDMNFSGLVNSGNEGIFWLNHIKDKKPETEVILMTAYADIDLAIRGLKEGASDFLVKPWKNEKIVQTIKDILESKKTSQRKKDHLISGGVDIIGSSEEMNDVFTKLKKVAPTEANILILGENGTGKDLVAKALHDQSNRRHQSICKGRCWCIDIFTF